MQKHYLYNILQQYGRNEPAVDGNGTISNFNKANVTKLFNFRAKIRGKTTANGRKDVGMMVLLKDLINFGKNLEISLANCKISRNLIWSIICFMVSTTTANQDAPFSITDIKLYVPGVTLLTEDNGKLLE